MEADAKAYAVIGDAAVAVVVAIPNTVLHRDISEARLIWYRIY